MYYLGWFLLISVILGIFVRAAKLTNFTKEEVIPEIFGFLFLSLFVLYIYKTLSLW
jgi:hypothetical protein